MFLSSGQAVARIAWVIEVSCRLLDHSSANVRCWTVMTHCGDSSHVSVFLFLERRRNTKGLLTISFITPTVNWKDCICEHEQVSPRACVHKRVCVCMQPVLCHHPDHSKLNSSWWSEDQGFEVCHGKYHMTHTQQTDGHVARPDLMRSAKCTVLAVYPEGYY